MKALLKALFFDREVVEAMKANHTSKELMYVHLISGKITMKEYIAASAKKR
jgi:hypothetical protein